METGQLSTVLPIDYRWGNAIHLRNPALQLRKVICSSLQEVAPVGCRIHWPHSEKQHIPTLTRAAFVNLEATCIVAITGASMHAYNRVALNNIPNPIPECTNVLTKFSFCPPPPNKKVFFCC